nr:hypothetical protein Iba_chr03aCG11120 [Ipomoea batatas]
MRCNSHLFLDEFVEELLCLDRRDVASVIAADQASPFDIHDEQRRHGIAQEHTCHFKSTLPSRIRAIEGKSFSDDPDLGFEFRESFEAALTDAPDGEGCAVFQHRFVQVTSSPVFCSACTSGCCPFCDSSLLEAVVSEAVASSSSALACLCVFKHVHDLSQLYSVKMPRMMPSRRGRGGDIV